METPTLLPTLSILKSIQKSLVKIETIVKSNSNIQQRQTEQQRRQRIVQTRQAQEKQAETPKLINPLKYLQGAFPKTGFLDSIRNFILYTFMGFAFTKLVKFLPKILSTLKFIDPFIKFTDNFVGSVFKNFVDAIDLGYEQYDKVRALAKQVGGEKFEKQFDDLSSVLNKFLNTAIIVGLAVAGSGAVGGGGKKLPQRITPRPGLGGAGGGSTRLSQYFSQTRAQEAVTKRYGFDAARFYQDKINKGLTPANALKAVRERFSAREIPTGGLAGKGRTAGRIGSRGFGKIQQRASLKLLGKGGAKILGKVPIIGPIADFLISTLIFKERPDRAAAGAVGAAVGTALGSFPALLPFGGPIWGGLLGDIVGRSLFDVATSMQGQGEKIQKKAAGGPVTRGGKPVGRTIKRSVNVRSRSLRRPRQQLPQPGQNIGGLKQITKVFSSPKKPGKKNPLRALKNISEIMNKNRDPLFGGIMIATSNLPLGQRPDPMLGQEIKNNFAALIDNAIAAQSAKEVGQIQRSVVSAAKGGVIPASRTLRSGPSIGEQLGTAIANSFQNALNSRTNQIFQSLRREMGLKGDDLLDGMPGPGGPGDGVELDQSQQEAFEKIRKIAEKVGSPNPSVTAAIAMIETGWLSNPNSVYFASGKTNPFGQTGRGPKGSVVGADGQEHAVYNNLEEGVKAHVDRWKSSYIGKTPQEIIESIRTGRGANAPGMYNTNRNWTNKVLSAYSSATAPAPSRLTNAQFKAVLPEGNPKLTSGFGMRNVDWGSRQHKGIDIGVDRGSRVLSLSDGTAYVLSNATWGSFGQAVVVDHGDGTSTLYGHVDPKVKNGAKVKKGDVIARVKFWPKGQYGAQNDDNTHLHLERRIGGVGFAGKAVDPSNYLSSVTPIIKPTPPAAPGQNPPRQPAAPPNQPIKNQGVVFKNGKFYKSGLFGLDQEIEVNNRTNIQLRQIPSFGLGRGTEGQLKKAKDGGYYRFINGNWVNIYEGGNASIQNVTPSSSIAKAQFTPLPTPAQGLDRIAQYDSSSDGSNMAKTNIVFIRQIEQVG